MTVTISGTNGVDLIKDDTVVTADIVNANVTPAKLSTGAPSWDSAGNLSFNSGYGSAATAYGCRAWVNFDGTFATSPFTIANGGIRASGNVSSITDDGTGIYTINFTNNMPDTNYVYSGGYVGPTAASSYAVVDWNVRTTSSFRIGITAASGTEVDNSVVNVCIFR